jgi:hypothetical protein
VDLHGGAAGICEERCNALALQCLHEHLAAFTRRGPLLPVGWHRCFVRVLPAPVPPINVLLAPGLSHTNRTLIPLDRSYSPPGSLPSPPPHLRRSAERPHRSLFLVVAPGRNALHILFMKVHSRRGWLTSMPRSTRHSHASASSSRRLGLFQLKRTLASKDVNAVMDCSISSRVIDYPLNPKHLRLICHSV